MSVDISSPPSRRTIIRPDGTQGSCILANQLFTAFDPITDTSICGVIFQGSVWKFNPQMVQNNVAVPTLLALQLTVNALYNATETDFVNLLAVGIGDTQVFQTSLTAYENGGGETIGSKVFTTVMPILLQPGSDLQIVVQFGANLENVAVYVQLFDFRIPPYNLLSN